MAEQGFCTSTGKCVGSAYRALAEQTEKIRGVLGSVGRNVASGFQELFAKFGGRAERLETDNDLAQWERKQDSELANLGREVYKAKPDTLHEIFPEAGIKEILSKVRENEDRIRKLKGEVQAQEKRAQEQSLFRHALKRIQSPDPAVRRSALQVLEKLRNKEAIPHVTPLLDDPDPEVCRKAKALIRGLTDTDKRPAVQPPAMKENVAPTAATAPSPLPEPE